MGVTMRQQLNGIVDAYEARCEELAAVRKELDARPTTWAYEQACKALAHWRAEAQRLGKLADEKPREMAI